MATNTQKKAQAHMAARDTCPSAHAKYVRILFPQGQDVIDLIRGKNVDEALAILQYTPRRFPLCISCCPAPLPR